MLMPNETYGKLGFCVKWNSRGGVPVKEYHDQIH